MGMSLKDFKDSFARNLYDMTKDEAVAKGVCIDCKKPPTFQTEAGRREYQISGLCEPCFNEITKEEDEEDCDDAHPDDIEQYYGGHFDE